jgi:eukaryotic-like serine/threonine-protein kinase
MAEVPAALQSALADRYTLERSIGSGGTATVYLARDRRHDRQVAVKVLRPELAATLGPERFLREIQIAARLTHPHILPLHESGEAAGFLYYVMPFVAGESLRGRLVREGKLATTEAALILREVADAIGYAHDQGVVHRDIKPDNVLLSGRHALVTDFGVAKALSEATGRQHLTTAGETLGTPAYMAPEQVAADPAVDYRADIYALGVLGYEMLAGGPPFAGSTPQETLAAQIAGEPEPVIRRRPDTPPAFADLIMRCLAKRPADRPQAVLDLLPTLDAVATPTGGRPPLPLVRPFSLTRLVFTALLVAGAGVVALVAHTRPTHLSLGTESRITDQPGLETDPVISPDGRFIAYAAGPYFTSHIYVRQLGGGPALDVTPTVPGRHTRPRWKPGGGELLFVTTDGRGRSVSVVSELGGPPRVVVDTSSDEMIASADWSPDARRIAYDLGPDILVRTLSGTGSVPVYHGTNPHSLSWSPDGQFLAFVEGGHRSVQGTTGPNGPEPSTILVLPLAGRAVDTISPRAGINLSPSWAPDSRSLLFISNRDGATDIYQAALGAKGALAGPQIRLTTGLNAHTVSFSPDGRHLAYSTLVREANVWVLTLRPGQTIADDSAVQVTSGNQVVDQFSVSHDGGWLAFDSDRRGNSDIYRVRLDPPGAGPEQLTSDSANDYSPAYSPDDRAILFHSLRDGRRNLWVMDSDGANPHQITSLGYDQWAGTWSPDGRAVNFIADSAGQTWLGVVTRDAEGRWGAPRLLLAGVQGKASWAPDGTWLAALQDGAVVAISQATGKARVLLPSNGMSRASSPIWSPDGRSVWFRRREPDGRLTLLAIPVAGGTPAVLVEPRDPGRSGPRSDWTTDGRRLFFTIGRYEGDISVVNVK